MELSVEEGLGGVEGVGGTEGVGEGVLCAGERVLEGTAGEWYGVEDLVLVDGGVAGEQRSGQRDSDGASDVSHEVEETAGAAHLFVAQGAVGGDGDGDEDEAEAEAGDEDGQEQGGGGDGEGDVAEVESGEAEDGESEGEEIAGVNPVGEVSDGGQSADGSEAARGDNQTGSECGVAEEFLVEEGKNDDGGVDGDAKEEDEQTSDAEVAVFKELEIDHGLVLAPGVPDKESEAGDEEEEGPADPEGAEPVRLLPLVQDDLKQACPDDEGAEAEVVERGDAGVLDVRRVVDEAVDHVEGEYADGDVDVEGVSPGVCVCEPAAEGGAEDGGDDDAEAEESHGGPALAWREGLQHDGLGERLKSAAAGPLDDARDQDEGESGSRSAGEAGDGEDGDTAHEEALAAKLEGAPVAGGEDDGVGDQVAGEHPGCLVGGGGERTGDVGESDRGDGGVQHLHEGGKHDGRGDEPGIDSGGDLGGEVGRCCSGFSHARR